MTQSLEDYLEAVYMISLQKRVIRVKDISEKLSVKKPSVVNALKELEHLNYLSHEKYGYIDLTQEGELQAKSILKKHTMLKDFLEKTIGVSEKAAEADACPCRRGGVPERPESQSEERSDEQGSERERDPAGSATWRGALYGLVGKRLGEAIAGLAQFAIEVAGGIVALVGIFAEAAFDGPSERGGDSGGQRAGFVANDGGHGFGGAGAAKGTLSGGELVEDQAERELIAAVVELAAAGLFGTHVIHGPDHHAGSGDGHGAGGVAFGRNDALGQTEIENPDAAVFGD